MKPIRTAHYAIHFSEVKAWQDFLSAKAYSNYFVVVDEHTAEDCLPYLKSISKVDLKIINTPSGESNKNLDSCKLIWDQMIAQGADRYSLCINLGGGVIGDMGGFCAASFMRGMDFVQVPTSLLAMVDASIGGKLGIDYQGLKNYIGLFKDPEAVFIFPRFLDTLAFEHLRSGFAEIIKHALIADAALWKDLREMKDISITEILPVLHTAITIKHNIVAADPKEIGQRKILNFGHTIGHALESYYLGTSDHLLHGEAVALGMICETYLSYKSGLLAQNQCQEISNFITNKYRDLLPRSFDEKAILRHCRSDKKNKNQRIQFSLLDGLAKACYDQQIDAVLILESLEQLKS